MADDPPASRSDFARRLRRRIPAYLLLVGAAVILVRYVSAQPSKVDVRLHFGAAGEKLVEARIAYARGNEELVVVEFSYGPDRATRSEAHDVRLPDGDYDVNVRLKYRGPGPGESLPQAGRPKATEDGHTLIRLRRTLLVKGDSAVTVFVGRDDR